MGQLRFSAFLESTNKDTWHRLNSRVSGPPKEASSWLLLNSLRAGLGRSLEAEVSIPAAWMEARDGTEQLTRSGVGDLLTRLSFGHRTGSFSGVVSAGAFWPVGELGSQNLPATATFSTGTVDPALGAYITGPPFGGFTWHVSFNTRLVVNEQSDGKQLGSSYTTSVGLGRLLPGSINGQLLLTYFARERDQGNMMEDTGGDWIYLLPYLSADVYASPSYAIQISIGARIPLMQRVEGIQLVESPNFSIGLAQTFNL